MTVSQEQSVVIDQSKWGHIKITGSDRIRFLNGMVSGNVKTLQPDASEKSWMQTLLLNHKARVLSIFHVHARPEYLLVSCEPSLTEKTFATLDRHIVMDDVELEMVEQDMHTIWTDPDSVWTAAPILAPSPLAASTEQAIEVMRIEAGMPRYGADVSENHFPFESLLVRLIDYDKGCFTGQEPVARVHARGGGGSKRLCGLRVQGTELPAVGAVVSTTERDKGGLVSSAVHSPKHGNIALATVHKSAWEPGSVVRVGEIQATVSELPF